MITIAEKITPKKPIFIAAWPGMGQVALKAAEHLRDTLKARPFAEVQAEAFFYETDIAIERSIIDVSSAPKGMFYYWENASGKQDLIIFIAEAQPPIEKNIAYAQAIVDFARDLKVETIITFAALVSSSDFLKTPKVWMAATSENVLKEFSEANVKPLEYGSVSGLNGLFLGVAKKNGLNGACILGEIPFYAVQIENPRASMAILESVSRYIDVGLDLTELSVAAKMIEEEIERLIEHAKRPSASEDSLQPISNDDIEHMKHLLEKRSHIPNSIRQRIEELFRRAQDDLTHAAELKQALDEWHVYKDYEDRFLELFKTGRDPNQHNG